MSTRRTTPARISLLRVTTGYVEGAAVTRGTERWCRVPFDDDAPDGPLACEWHTEASYGGTRDEWTTASTWPAESARALLYLLARQSTGRPPAKPRTPDGDLVAQALAASGLRTLTALADDVGTSVEQLSRCNVPKADGTRGSAHPLPPLVLSALERLADKGKRE